MTTCKNPRCVSARRVRRTNPHWRLALCDACLRRETLALMREGDAARPKK